MDGVSVQDVVGAAYQLLGAPYRRWFIGDLINFALERNGLPPGGGTVTFAHYLVRTGQFDPDTPGEPGAIAFRPYEGPGQAQQGSIALYVGEHQLIQAIPEAGVTDAYTDQETFSWGAQHRFTVYGFLPGVSY